MHTVLIIRCGSIRERHLRCFPRTKRGNVAACDTNQEVLERIASDYQVPTLSNIPQALSEEFAAVIICTPARLHLPIALEALRSGFSVLIEQPLAVSHANVDKLIEPRNRTDCYASIAYILHVYPIHTQAQEFLLSDAIGTVRHVTSTNEQYFPGGRPVNAVHYSNTSYRDRHTGGGAIQGALTHTTNWVESVVGSTDRAVCDCARQVPPGLSVEEAVNLCAPRNEVLVDYTANQFQAPNESTLQFDSTKGSVETEVPLRRWGFYRWGDASWT